MAQARHHAVSDPCTCTPHPHPILCPLLDPAPAPPPRRGRPQHIRRPRRPRLRPPAEPERERAAARTRLLRARAPPLLPRRYLPLYQYLLSIIYPSIHNIYMISTPLPLLYHAGPPKVVQVAVPVTQKPYVVQVSWDSYPQCSRAPHNLPPCTGAAERAGEVCPRERAHPASAAAAGGAGAGPGLLQPAPAHPPLPRYLATLYSTHYTLHITRHVTLLYPAHNAWTVIQKLEYS